MNPEDRRRAPRSRTQLVVELYEPEGRLVLGVGRLLDLSSMGFRFESNLRLHPHQLLRARVRMKRDLLVEVPVKVAWTRSKGIRHAYGMEFKGISKTDYHRMEQWVKEHQTV
jgi:hypothetical protein